MSVWTDNLAKLRSEEAAAVQAAQIAEPMAASNPSPAGHLQVIGYWNAAGAAAMAQVALFAQYIAQAPPGSKSAPNTVANWDKPMGNWPTVPHQKVAKDRAWWYYEFARLQGYEAEKKGAPPPPKKPPPTVYQKPTGRPTTSPGNWGPSTTIGDAASTKPVLVDSVTGSELGPDGLPLVPSIFEGIGAMIPGESPLAKLASIAVVGIGGLLLWRRFG